MAGSDFERHLAAENWNRRFYLGKMRRGEKVSTVRRNHKCPALGEVVTNLAPWQMTFLNGELLRWEKAGISKEDRREMLIAFVKPLRRLACFCWRGSFRPAASGVGG